MLQKDINYLKNNILSFSSSDDETVILPYCQTDIEKIIPHRQPFLFIDRLTQLSLTETILEGEHYIQPDNKIFLGHFPEKPIYPGVLHIEMMGQLGVCLLYFIQHNITHINPALPSVSGLFTKIHHTTFLAPLYPDDTVQIRVKLREHDAFLATMVGQIIKNKTVCSFSILEAYLEE